MEEAFEAFEALGGKATITLMNGVNGASAGTVAGAGGEPRDDSGGRSLPMRRADRCVIARV